MLLLPYGVISKQKSNKDESKVTIDNNTEIKIKFIRLNLSIGYTLLLKNTFYVLLFSQNLVLISILKEKIAKKILLDFLKL